MEEFIKDFHKGITGLFIIKTDYKNLTGFLTIKEFNKR